jgi:hypothetical protein
MFIATSDPTTVAPEERKVTHPLIFRSSGAGPIMWRPLVYKHFVPTGRRTFQQAVLSTKDKSNTPTEHYR